MPRINPRSKKPLCLNTVRQKQTSQRSNQTMPLCLNTVRREETNQTARKEVLCLNTELQLLAARSSTHPTQKRRAEKEGGRGSKCCALTQSQLPQRQKQDRKNQSPEGKRIEEQRKGHGEARTSNTLTAPPCECSIKYSTDMLEPNQGKNVQMQAQLSESK